MGRKIETLIYGRVPPQAPELEEAILGAIMLEKDAIETAMGVLANSDMFYTPANQKIYEAMLRIYKNGGMVDLLTVTEELRKADELEVAGGAYYLTTLTMGVVNGAHVENHAKIVYETFMKRETIRICGAAISDAYEEGTDAFDISALAAAQLTELGEVATSDMPEPIHSIAMNEVISIGEKREAGVSFGGVTTGFPTLDKLTGGWQDTDLIILAARPAVGKTAFVMNLALNAGNAVTDVFNVLFFSLEMSKGQIGKRALSATSGVELEKIYRNVLSLSDAEMKTLQLTAEKMNKCRLHVNDKAAISPLYVKRVAKARKKKTGLDMIIIDYLQLMRPSVKEGSRERDIASISAELKSIAKELEVPTIALSQLNREGEGGEPDLRHLRESGAIEQDADLVAFLYAPDANQPEQITLKIAKHRNGATDKVPFRFEKSRQKFYDAVFESQQPYIPDNPRAGIANRDFTNNSQPYKD